MDPLPRADRRVEFIRQSLVALDGALGELGGGLNWPIWASTSAHGTRLAQPPAARRGVPSLESLGFVATNILQHVEPGAPGAARLLQHFLRRIDRYAELRDYPAAKGPSHLSVHLRFGTVLVRELARAAHERMRAGSRGAEVWLSELIWRDFYHQVLHHHPHVVDGAFRREYEAVEWERGPAADVAFAAWCVPIVDHAEARTRTLARYAVVKERG